MHTYFLPSRITPGILSYFCPGRFRRPERRCHRGGKSLGRSKRPISRSRKSVSLIWGVTGSMFDTKLSERISEIGNSSSLSPSEPLVVLSFLASSTLSSLREYAAAIIGIREGLCSYIHKVMFLNNNKQLIRCMKVLQYTILCEETICTNRSPSGRLKLAAPYVYPDYATYALATFTENVLAGKHFDIYIYIPIRGLLYFPSILFRYIYCKS